MYSTRGTDHDSKHLKMRNDALQLDILLRVALLSMCMFQLEPFDLLYSRLVLCLQQLVTQELSSSGVN